MTDLPSLHDVLSKRGTMGKSKCQTCVVKNSDEAFASDIAQVEEAIMSGECKNSRTAVFEWLRATHECYANISVAAFRSHLKNCVGVPSAR